MPKPLPTLEGRFFYRVKRLAAALRSSSDSSLRGIGLSAPQYTTMVALAAQPGASNATLARTCFVTPQTMNELVRGLENAKLVERLETDDARREIALQLTEEGRRRVAAGHKKILEVEAAAFEGMSEGQRRAFLGHLDALAATLDALAATVEAGRGKERASRKPALA